MLNDEASRLGRASRLLSGSAWRAGKAYASKIRRSASQAPAGPSSPTKTPINAASPPSRPPGWADALALLMQGGERQREAERLLARAIQLQPQLAEAVELWQAALQIRGGPGFSGR